MKRLDARKLGEFWAEEAFSRRSAGSEGVWGFFNFSIRSRSSNIVPSFACGSLKKAFLITNVLDFLKFYSHDLFLGKKELSKK